MSLETDIETLHSGANECRILMYNLEDDIVSTPFTSFQRAQYGTICTVQESLREVMYDLIDAFNYFRCGHTATAHWSLWHTVHRGLFLQEAELTWKTIVEAWVANDFEGRAMTIAVIDRMRQILWDEPFYIKWAARPEVEV